MRIEINWKALGILLAIIMTIITVPSAMAIDLQFNATNDIIRWQRLTPDLIATYDPNVPDTINYYSSSGLVKSIDISPYSAARALKFGEKDADTPEDIYFVCDYIDEELCIVDYSGGDLDQENMTPIYDMFYTQHGNDPSGNIADIAAVTDKLILVSFGGGWRHAFDRSMTVRKDYGNNGRLNDTDSSSNLALCEKEKSGLGTPDTCPHTDYVAHGSNWEILLPKTVHSIPKTNRVYQYFTDNSGYDLAWDNVTHGTWWIGSSFGGGTKYFDWCFAQGTDEMVCNMGNDLVQAEFYDQTNARGSAPSYQYPGTPFYGDSVQMLWYDSNQQNHEVIINGTQSEIIIYESGVRQNTGANMTSYYSENAFALDNDVVIYSIGTTTYRLTNNFTAPSPPIDNETETYYNVTPEANNTYNETIFSLELIGGDEIIMGRLVGSDEYIYVYDYSTPSSLSEVDNAQVGDEIYKTSKEGNNIFVGSDNGIYVYDYATLTEQEHDTWRYIPLVDDDNAYDVAGLTNTTAMACDNNDEPDYYTAGSKPTTNVGGSCYDIEIDGDYMYVDSDIAGIRIYNISTPSAPLLITTVNDRTDTYTWTHGDFLDLDTTNELLLAKRNIYSFNVYDISAPSSTTELVACNNGGAGEVTAVEFISDDIAIAGTANGRISICDLNNFDETTNTDWYTLEGMNGESIQALEYDGNYIHAIGQYTYTISSFDVGTVNTTTNTPPTLDNYTISDTELLLDQEVDITIIAGNVEPEDVIRYGLKCEGTESSYSENTNGEFTCSYNVSGTYNVTMAVTDNYHTGTWYDETIQQVTVLDTNFTGGTLRILVLDTNSLAIDNVQVDADNQTLYTNALGSVTFTTETTGLYEVTAQKTGYYTAVNSFYADGTIYPVTMTLVGNGSTTLLRVTVTDEDDEALQDAIVSYTNSITYEYDYTFTDGSGLAYFDDISPGIVIVQGSKEGYDANSENIVVIESTINDVEIELPTLNDAFVGEAHFDRNCVDNGLWLCGATPVVEHSCVIDDDCELSNFCTPGVNTCHRFNYSQCDVAGLPRSQKCVTKLTGEQTLTNITNWMLGNLLWVIVLLILLISVGMIFISWKK